MPHTPIWRRYLRFFGSDIAADVEDKLQFHLQSKMNELIAQGWKPELARTEAHRQFGSLSAVRQTCEIVAKEREKRVKKAEYVSACYQDIRYGLLQLRHNVGTTCLAVLRLGMGAVTAVFSIVYAVLLPPLSFSTPDRLVSLWSTREGVDDVVTPRNFDVWRRESRSFSRIGALQPTTFTLSQPGSATQVPGGFASAEFFQVFGTSPELGRIFTPGEDQQPRLHLAVLSHRLGSNILARILRYWEARSA